MRVLVLVLVLVLASASTFFLFGWLSSADLRSASESLLVDALAVPKTELRRRALSLALSAGAGEGCSGDVVPGKAACVFAFRSPYGTDTEAAGLDVELGMDSGAARGSASVFARVGGERVSTQIRRAVTGVGLDSSAMQALRCLGVSPGDRTDSSISSSGGEGGGVGLAGDLATGV